MKKKFYGFLNEPPFKKRKLITDIGIALLIFYVASVIINYLSVILVALIFASNIGDIIIVSDIDKTIENIMSLVNDNMPIIFGFTILSYVVITIVTVYVRINMEYGTPKSMGIVKRKSFLNWVVGFVIGFALSLILTFSLILESGQKVKFEFDFSADNIGILVLFFIGFFLQGMAEEVLFRGYLFTSITRSHNIILAMMMSSLIFAVMHIPNDIGVIGVLSIFAMAVLMCLLFLLTENLMLCCGLHTAWNFAIACLFSIEDSIQIEFPSLVKLVDFSLNENSFVNKYGQLILMIICIGITIIPLSIKISRKKKLNT